MSAFRAQTHVNFHSTQPTTGIKEGGNMLIMGGTGPMGHLSKSTAHYGPKKPSTLLLTDVNQAKLDRAKKLYPSVWVDIKLFNVNNLSL